MSLAARVIGPPGFKRFLEEIDKQTAASGAVTKGIPMTKSTVRQVVDDALKSMAGEIAKRHAAKGEAISPAKSHVEAYRTAKGRELLALRKHRFAHLPVGEFKAALQKHNADLPRHGVVIDEVQKRAQSLLDSGAAKTIEQARVAVRGADRELAAREREARRELR